MLSQAVLANAGAAPAESFVRPVRGILVVRLVIADDLLDSRVQHDTLVGHPHKRGYAHSAARPRILAYPNTFATICGRDSQSILIRFSCPTTESVAEVSASSRSYHAVRKRKVPSTSTYPRTTP